MAQIIVGKQSNIKEFPFADEVHDMADYVASNPQILGSDMLIFSRELQVGTVNDSRRIDFLVYDTELNQIGIVELKNQTADEKVLLQTLRYANWIRNNPDTVRYQLKKQSFEVNEEEIDTESIKILIVAPKITQALVELCRYITSFDFEFIQLQRFKDETGQIYAVTNIIEIETSASITPKSRGTYDIDWYESNGVRAKQLEELKQSIDALNSICQNEGWALSVRWVKWSVRFQTPGGRNAFYINVRKTQNHYLKFCLGPEFDLSSIKLEQTIKDNIKHKKKTSRWWTLMLNVDEISEYVPLLTEAYENILE